MNFKKIADTSFKDTLESWIPKFPKKDNIQVNKIKE